MAYLTAALNHFRQVQLWAQAANAEVTLDVRNFELEVRCNHRFYSLFPQFFSKLKGRLGHVPTLTEGNAGFIGWLPYKPLSWELSSDKLMFKHVLKQFQERTPSSWTDMSQVDADYILKQSVGSFGYELAGPFRVAHALKQDIAGHAPGIRGTTFAEQFVVGDNIKVWFWGREPFFAHRHAYPEVHGDGNQTIGELIQERSKSLSHVLGDTSLDKMTIDSVIAYQYLTMETVLSAGQAVWIDYRYGRRYVDDFQNNLSDNAIPNFGLSLMEQIERLGVKLEQELSKQFPAPVLYSVDGVIDSDDHIWWLEMNSNPMFPPAGYKLVFNTLFGVDFGNEAGRPDGATG
jgi:hypothetical protein